jgi:hypothetical protein
MFLTGVKKLPVQFGQAGQWFGGHGQIGNTNRLKKYCNYKKSKKV